MAKLALAISLVKVLFEGPIMPTTHREDFDRDAVRIGLRCQDVNDTKAEMPVNETHLCRQDAWGPSAGIGGPPQ